NKRRQMISQMLQAGLTTQQVKEALSLIDRGHSPQDALAAAKTYQLVRAIKGKHAGKIGNLMQVYEGDHFHHVVFEDGAEDLLEWAGSVLRPLCRGVLLSSLFGAACPQGGARAGAGRTPPRAPAPAQPRQPPPARTRWRRRACRASSSAMAMPTSDP